jgi:uncharacterized glyoxalase superfamily protein PhnB
MTSTITPAPAGATKRAQPESLRGRALMASLTAKDLDASLAWYTNVLGFTIDQKYERDGKVFGVALKAGAVRILLNQDDGAKGWDRVKGEGFALQITTVQNIDEVAKRIKDNGGTLESEPADMPWGARVFRVRDPDGFKLSISTPR